MYRTLIVWGKNQRVKELSQSSKYRQRLKLLCSVPGIGTLSGMEILVELRDVERFKRADELASYIAWTPSEFSTGQYVRQGGSPGEKVTGA